MEDIKILERMLEIEKECLHYDVSQDEIQAIKNLINRNKELEEENKIQRGQLNSAFDRGFIHKDKVKEKIEELKKIKYSEEKCEKINNMYYKMIKQYDYEIAQFTIKILQELLEE